MASPTPNAAQFSRSQYADGYVNTEDDVSSIRGNEGATKSAIFAETYMDYYMTHLVDEKGLFWWGWHRHYDVYTDQMTGHGGNVHELHAMHCIDWFRLWEINPPAVQREIEAIWEWHVIDKVTGETDRHDSQQPGCDFSMSAGAYLYAFAFLSYQLQDSKWLDRAKLLANYYWHRRNPATDFFRTVPMLEPTVSMVNTL